MQHQEQQDGMTETPQPGLMADVGSLGRHLLALLVNRVELASLELGEVRDKLARLLLVGVLGLVALCFALACWTALIIVLAWDSLGWKILLIIAALYTALAAGVLLRARTMLQQEKLALPATLAELRGDRDALM
jgi:uncharacterized membrane protein YqjE